MNFLLKIFQKLFILLLFQTIICYPQIPIKGDIIELIKSIRNSMPTAGTNKFVIPDTNAMNSFQYVFNSIKNNSLIEISGIVNNFNYKFYEFLDTLSYKTYYILLEETPLQYGWGTFIFFNNSITDITIEVPHPIWDTNSWDVGIRVFLKLNAKWFIMAGTHRYANSDSSSDVAHTTKSIFNISHQTISTPISIQIHGFNKSNNIYNGYPDIVISNGTLYPDEILYTLSKNFEMFNFTTGVFSKDTYSQLSRLGATKNVQGQWSKSNNQTFIHIEFDYPLRTNQINVQKIQLAMYNTFITKNNDFKFSNYKLYQNYPNPCNTLTTIEIEIPKQAFSNLRIFDVLGRTIFYKTINTSTGGKYKTEISLNNLSSGLYFYQLEGENYKETKKMIIIK